MCPNSQIYLHLILRQKANPLKSFLLPLSLSLSLKLHVLRQEAIERKIKIYRIVYCLEMSGRLKIDPGTICTHQKTRRKKVSNLVALIE